MRAASTGDVEAVIDAYAFAIVAARTAALSEADLARLVDIVKVAGWDDNTPVEPDSLGAL